MTAYHFYLKLFFFKGNSAQNLFRMDTDRRNVHNKSISARQLDLLTDYKTEYNWKRKSLICEARSMTPHLLVPDTTALESNWHRKMDFHLQTIAFITLLVFSKHKHLNAFNNKTPPVWIYDTNFTTFLTAIVQAVAKNQENTMMETLQTTSLSREAKE